MGAKVRPEWELEVRASPKARPDPQRVTDWVSVDTAPPSVLTQITENKPVSL